jgi:hypothetical protein
MKIFKDFSWRKYVGAKIHYYLMHFYAFFKKNIKRNKHSKIRTGVAICAVFKDENQYVREWIDYHIKIGIVSFLLYDNMSQIPLEHTLKEYIDKGIVKVIHKKGEYDSRQAEAYNDSVNHLQNYEWAAYIDIDEFIVLLGEETNINDYLKKHNDTTSSIGLNWLMFGSNGHKDVQTSIINSYTQSCPGSHHNKHIKSIVRLSRFYWTDNPHYFFITKGNIVNVREEPIKKGSPFNNPPILNEIMRINHYYTRSYEDFKLKQKRGRGDCKLKAPDEYYLSLQKENAQNFDIINLINRINQKNKVD